jgi:CMP-N-acetylneuraminic acid synthetase
MKIVAVMPIKMNNERLPGKNIKLLGEKPLLKYELENLIETNLVDSINVFCSDECICQYLPAGVSFIKRPEYLDLPNSNFSQIFEKFMSLVYADIYVYAHATAPFISVDTMRECILAVKNGNYDSAFCAVKIQDYLWQDGLPLNFNAANIPRSQDIKPIFRETSGVYVFRRKVFEKYHRRIGINPYVKEVTYKEAVDINNPDDFKLAQAMLNIDF